MGYDHFYLFTALASFNQSIQERLKTVQSPEDIVQIAAEKGYQITINQLAYFAKRLNGNHWVWAGQSDEWVDSFFGESNTPLHIA